LKKKRLVKHSSKRVVQKSSSRVKLASSSREKVFGVLPQPLPQAAEDILKVLGSGWIAEDAARVAGVNKSDVWYWKERFVFSGALITKESQVAETLGLPRKERRYSAGNPKYYILTPYGSKLLAGSDNGGGRLPVVFEDYPVKFLALRWERVGSVDWEKLGSPRNWQPFGFRVTGVRVVKTTKHVIVHPGPLKGFDPNALAADAGRIIERVRYILESDRFGMRLADDGEPLHGPMWQVFRPESRQWKQEGGVVKGSGVGALDASPKPWLRELSNVPHVEYEKAEHAAIAAGFPFLESSPGKVNAYNAVMFPTYLEEIHRTVLGLSARVDELTIGVGSVTQFEGQVSEVMRDLKSLAAALGKLENLDKIRESLQTVSGILSQLVDAEGNGSQGQASKSTQDNVQGGSQYVS
jgi:hypothetical protein